MVAWGGSIEVISLWENLYWFLSVHNEDINFITHLSHWLCPVDIVLHYLFCYLRVLKKSTTVELKPLKYFITENVGSACKFSSQTVFISVHIYMLLQTPGFYFILTNVRVNGWIAVELLRVYMSIILYQDLNKSPVKQFCGFLQLERSEAVVKKKKKKKESMEMDDPTSKEIHRNILSEFIATCWHPVEKWPQKSSFHHLYSNLRQRPLKVMLLNLKFCLSDRFKEFKSLSAVTAGKAAEIRDIGKAPHFIWSLLHSRLSWCNWVYEEPSSVSV